MAEQGKVYKEEGQNKKNLQLAVIKAVRVVIAVFCMHGGAIELFRRQKGYTISCFIISGFKGNI